MFSSTSSLPRSSGRGWVMPIRWMFRSPSSHGTMRCSFRPAPPDLLPAKRSASILATVLHRVRASLHDRVEETARLLACSGPLLIPTATRQYHSWALR